MRMFIRGILVTLAVIYFVSPDALPGPIDDVLVFLLALNLFRGESYIE